MKNNKLALISFSVLLLLVVAIPVVTLASAVQLGAGGGNGNVPTSVGNLGEIVTKIESMIWIVFGLLAVIMFVVAGILFLTAGGAPEKVQTARAAFIWGIVGVAVGIVAYSIVAVVSGVLGTG